MARTSKTVMVDAGYWMAVLTPTDGYHADAMRKVGYLDSLTVLCPWPTLYETFRTRFFKNPVALKRYQQYMRPPRVQYIDDTPYRDRALEQLLSFASTKQRRIALVDMVLRFMLEDVNLRVDSLLTFNEKDFVDVCRDRRIEMLY